MGFTIILLEEVTTGQELLELARSEAHNLHHLKLLKSLITSSIFVDIMTIQTLVRIFKIVIRRRIILKKGDNIPKICM